ncbi:MAG: cyclase family protein [Actinomycetota bacterium]
MAYEFIDVSIGIYPGMVTWPSDPGVSVERVSDMAQGKSANVSALCMGSHTGTHIDPPLHFIPEGMPIDRIPPETLVGPAEVVDFTHVPADIGAADLEAAGLPQGVQRILFKTRNSQIWRRPDPEFTEDYVALAPDGARWVVEHKVKLVGIDFLSIERRGTPGHPTHVELLSNEVVIIEGLDLSGVEPGRYELVCLPMKLIGGDGGPSRAFLRRI